MLHGHYDGSYYMRKGGRNWTFPPNLSDMKETYMTTLERPSVASSIFFAHNPIQCRVIPALSVV